jgi:hypothetical protein
MYEGRKRVILIAAAILAARKLSQFDGGKQNVPPTGFYGRCLSGTLFDFFIRLSRTAVASIIDSFWRSLNPGRFSRVVLSPRG